jgi:hypothetical protein
MGGANEKPKQEEEVKDSSDSIADDETRTSVERLEALGYIIHKD